MSRFWVKITSVVILLLLFIILILQNVTTVAVNLFFWSFQLPLIVLMLISLLVGFVVGLLVYALSVQQKQ
ncbi:LapA family protein [Thermospira aquatica]|uniref:LapA family protein n=1 Tax=Thermospira aquatica TaxID=2828656 RepID=A0AAX3BAT2_9SPIR|nr:LapA family protein [Thermospira aquatica]URA09319.1 LapA family protein [Thermospira aquatica]